MKNQKGFLHLVPIVIVAILIAGGAGYVYRDKLPFLPEFMRSSASSLGPLGDCVEYSAGKPLTCLRYSPNMKSLSIVNTTTHPKGEAKYQNGDTVKVSWEILDSVTGTRFLTWKGPAQKILPAQVGARAEQIILPKGTVSLKLTGAGKVTVIITATGTLGAKAQKSIEIPSATAAGKFPTLTCSASASPVTGKPVTITSKGGNPLVQYKWTAEGTPKTGTGKTFNTTYNTKGQKRVTVINGVQTAQCSFVVALAPPTPTPTPTPSATAAVKKYKCNNSGACVENATGTYTNSDCDNACTSSDPPGGI